MTHLKRIVVGLIVLFCIIVLALSVGVFISMTIDALDVSVEIFFAVFLVAIAAILIAYGFGLMVEMWKNPSSRPNPPKGPPG